MADNISSITSSGSNNTTTTTPVTVQQKGSIGGGSAAGGAGEMHHYHHHHHHPHHHHHNHHKSLEMRDGAGKMGGSKHHTNVIHRTTSESLRLGGGGGGGGGGGVGGSGTGNGDSLMNSVSGGVSGMMGGASGNGTSLGSGENSVSSSSVNSIGRKGGSSNATGGASGQGGAPGTGGKTSSFMITSVTVGASSRNSADNGDDSADDLDESHTDDNSRITDFENETPSFSEDTFSKEDVFFGTNAIGSVPVIPTSSQYGLAIVNPNDRAHGGEVLADAMHVSVTEGGLNIMGHGKGDIGDGKELHHRNERFKVVKIESTEPFKRGRWVCMDYLDHTTLQQPAKESGGGTGSQGEGGEAGGPSAAASTQDSGVALTADNPVGGTGYGSTTAESSLENPNSAAEYHAATAPATGATSVATANSSTVNSSAALLGMLNNESPGQSLNLPLGGGNGGQQMAPPQPSHVQPPGTAAAAATTSGQQQPAGAGIPHSLPQSQLQNALAGQAPGPAQPAPATAQYPQQGQSQYYPHTMTNLADLNVQQSANQAPHQHHQHGATLPSNMQMHPAAAAGPPQQPAVSAISSSNILPASIPTSQEMNIIIGNPTIQSSFPSPHQQQAFKQQQQQAQAAQASQTNSPVVVVPSSLIDCVPDATILSPSATTNPPVAAVGAPDTAGSVSVVEPPSATSSPVTNASSQIIPQPTAAGAAAPPPSVLDPSVASSSSVSPATSSSAAVAPANGTTQAAAAAAVVGSPSTAVAGVSTSSSSTVVGAEDPESKLLSAVAGVTAAPSSTSSSGGEDTDKAATEDGESVAGLPPPQHQQQHPPLAANALERNMSARALHHQTPQQPQQQQQLLAGQQPALLSKAYSLPPSMAAATKESLRKDLTQHSFDQQHHPLHSTSHSPLRSIGGGGGGAFSAVVSSTQPRPQQHAPPGNGGGIYTDIALGKSIQNLMKPPTPTLAAAVSNRLVAGGSLPRSFGSLGTCRELPEHGEPLAASPPAVSGGPYCRAATNLLGGFTGSNSVSGCTVTHAHRCVQDLIREELGGGRMAMGGGGGGGMAPRLGKAGSMINMMSIDSAADVFSGGSGGSQSHPASGRSSPASYLYTGTPIGSPPRIVGSVPGYLLGPASYGSSPAAGSTRVSRAPSPSFLPTHANSAGNGGDHASASGTGAVAIDNKIEQAMDLVKSHLMFAVREEVEVLKERISELMDRINQLEYENNILKANASQETLSLLTTGGNSVSASSVAAAAQQQQQVVTAIVAAAVAATTVPSATAAAGTNTKAPAPPPSSANPANGSVS